MRWAGGRKSENLEDRRGMRGPAMAVGGVGLLVVIIGALLGVDPQQLLDAVPQEGPGGAGGAVAERELTEEELRTRDFTATVLAFTEEVWAEQFRRAGQEYIPPKMVLFEEAVQTGCGNAPSAVGPFYCPADRTVYLD